MPKIGEKAPDFARPDQDGKVHRLSDYRGQWVVLYFYPMDDTPGCTAEACAFRDRMGDLTGLGAQVLGISAQDGESHQAFAQKYQLNFPLLADPDREIIDAYGVWGTMSFMGSEFEATQRHTFLIDPEGKVAEVWTKVRPETHPEEVAQALAAHGAA
jgi:peroxiredoxin Q/BCP